MPLAPDELEFADDEIGPALSFERLKELTLDHLGGSLAVGPYTGKREEAFTKWREGIYEVASCPNVYIKLGGLGMKLSGFMFLGSRTSAMAMPNSVGGEL